MIFCVYMNPTIDKTVYLKRLEVGGTNRAERVVTDGAGKAVNVAVVLRMLEKDVTVTGLLYRSDGEIVKDRLKKSGATYNFTELEGTSRTNTKIFDETAQQITELNENGLAVPATVQADVARKIIENAEKGDIVVLTGSLPPGCGAAYYAGLVKELNRKGVRCVLDADGETLRQGVKEKPYFIKPNLDELAALTGCKPQSPAEIKEDCHRLIDSGISLVGVSLGSEGAILCDSAHAYYAKPVRVDVLSTVGAGDSMVAGILADLDATPNALRTGVAAATGSITREGTLLCTKEMFERYQKVVEISEI